MHYGWRPGLRYSGPHRCRHPHVTDLSCLLQRSERRDFLLPKLWAEYVHLPWISPEAGHFATTRWLPLGRLPPGRRAWQGSRVSPLRQMVGGWCGAVSGLHELWKLRKTQRFTYKCDLNIPHHVFGCRLTAGRCWGYQTTTPCVGQLNVLFNPQFKIPLHIKSHKALFHVKYFSIM